MARRAQCENPEVQAIIEFGTQSMEWVAHEFSGVDLSDNRLDRRLIKVAEPLARSPASPINEACGDWPSTQAAYRLFDHAKATPAAILEPHIAATVKRMAAYGDPILVMQNTIFFSYGKHVQTRGLGPIGKSHHTGERGLILHDALAFTASGVPLGLLSQQVWARREVPEKGPNEKILRLQCIAIEEKESSKWWLALHDTVARTPPGVSVVTVTDRESDFFEFLTQAAERRARYLIRARTDRQLVSEDSDGGGKMLEAINAATVQGDLTIRIPGNGTRKARSANLEVRVTQVTIKAPQRRGAAKASGSSEPITVNLIAATETASPTGTEAIGWVLLTSLPVRDFAEIAEKVQGYARRWGIETRHKALKSGCKVEDCRLEEAERLKRYLAMFSIIGVRLMHAAYLACVRPDLPVIEGFSEAEIQVLYLRGTGVLPSAAQPPSLREAVRLLGKLGGHLRRKCDGKPGLSAG